MTHSSAPCIIARFASVAVSPNGIYKRRRAGPLPYLFRREYILLSRGAGRAEVQRDHSPSSAGPSSVPTAIKARLDRPTRLAFLFQDKVC